MLTEKAQDCFPDGFASKKAHAAYTNREDFFGPRLPRLRVLVQAMTFPHLDPDTKALFELDTDPAQKNIVVCAENGSQFLFILTPDSHRIEAIVNGTFVASFYDTNPDDESHLINTFLNWTERNTPAARLMDLKGLIEYALLEIQNMTNRVLTNQLQLKYK